MTREGEAPFQPAHAGSTRASPSRDFAEVRRTHAPVGTSHRTPSVISAGLRRSATPIKPPDERLPDVGFASHLSTRRKRAA